MKKKIIHSLTLISFVGYLTACNSGSGTISTNYSKAAQNTKAASSENVEASEKQVWNNLVMEAGEVTNGSLNILVENNSQYMLHIVSCEKSDGVEESFKLRDFNPGYMQPRTKNYLAEFQNFDNGDGIYDPSHIADNHLTFNNVASDKINNTYVSCKVVIDIPETNKQLTAKLKFTSAHTADNPDMPNAQENAAQQANDEATAEYGAAKTGAYWTGVNTLGVVGAWAGGRNTVTTYNDTVFFNAVEERVGKMNTYLQNIKRDSTFVCPSGDQLCLKTKEYFENDPSLLEFEAKLDANGEIKILAPKFGGQQEEVVSLNNLSHYANGQTLNTNDATADAFAKMKNDPAQKEGLKVIGVEEDTFDILKKEVRPATETRFSKAGKRMFAAASIADIVTFAATIYRVARAVKAQKRADKQWVMEGMFDQDDPATLITQSSQNSTLLNQATLSFAPDSNSDIDQQISVTLSLTNITSPFDRINSNALDPFLGDVSVGSTHEHSSVVLLSLDSISSNASMHELSYDYKQANAEYIGIGKPTDTRLNAPIVSKIDYPLNNAANSMSSTKLNALIKQKAKELAKTSSTTNSAFSDAVFLTENQEANIGFQLPVNSFYTSGSGMMLDMIGEDEADGVFQYAKVRSKALKDIFDQSGNPIPYLYSIFDCGYPLTTNKLCNLKLQVGGLKNDNAHHVGKIYIADDSSHITTLPVYFNYRLISEPFAFSLTEGQTGEWLLDIANTTKDNYERIELSGLPKEAVITSDTCNPHGLAHASTCQISLELSGLYAGNYDVKINGYKSGQVEPTEADSSNLSINVSGGW